MLDLATHAFRYVSAGHPAPIYLPRDGAATILDKPSFPIGWFEKPQYEEHAIEMNPGDRLYLYSDGVLEAKNASDEEFGRRRLIDALESCRGARIEESIESLLHDIEAWRGDVPLEDDVSVVAIEIAGT